MTLGLVLGRPMGVQVVVGASWLIVTPILAVGMFAATDPVSGSVLFRGSIGALGAGLLLLSVIGHELAHALVAARSGVAVDRVAVFLLGGYSEIHLDGSRPARDAAIVLAGPVVSGLLAGVLAGLSALAPDSGGLGVVLWLVAMVNGGVAVFNLVPAFPLDGGRLMCAALVSVGVDRPAAERVAIGSGLVLGGLFGVAGVVASGLGSGASLVLVPAGVLLFGLAWAARREVQGDSLPESSAEEI